MKFNLDGLTVYFPYEYIYPEQYDYMLELKRAIDAKGHCVLEMPSGTGKTIALLSLITSYKLANPNVGKLVYCTRTVPEMEKVLEELKILISYRESMLGEAGKNILAIGLSARKNLCVNPRVLNVNTMHDGAQVDSRCRSVTASFVREKAKEEKDAATTAAIAAASSGNAQPKSAAQRGVTTCPWYEEFENSGTKSIIPAGVYTLGDLKKFGLAHGWCPYFLARRAVEYADVVVYNYSYLLDPKISALVSRKLLGDCIVVFDEAHNIDNVCIDALSVNINTTTIEQSIANLGEIQKNIGEMKQTNAARLEAEYRKLVNGLAASGVGRTDELLANPVLPADILEEAVPGNIRKAEHFVGFMRRFIEYVRGMLQVQRVVIENPTTFLQNLYNKTQIEQKPLRFCSDRLMVLLNTLEIEDLYRYQYLRVMCDFATLVGTYQSGFTLIMEPYDNRTPSIPDPVLQFSCLDASIAIKPVFDKFRTVVITSGTLSPLDIYPRMLKFQPAISKSFTMTLTRNCICPMVVARGSDQVAVTTKFDVRNDPSVVRNYGSLLIELCKVVPDGIICFFTSYRYMEDTLSMWNDMKLLDAITKHKLVFIETPSTAETALALSNYRKACDSGRGAVLMSIARGKVAEGIDFDGHYGRAVVMFGIPFVYTESRILKARLEYLRDKFQIRENDFLTFDAIRQAAQCIGRVIRNKTDYGLMILADKRFNRIDKRQKFPKWIASYLTEMNLNLSTDSAVTLATKFLKEMAQPWQREKQLGFALYSEQDVNQKASGGAGGGAAAASNAITDMIIDSSTTTTTTTGGGGVVVASTTNNNNTGNGNGNGDDLHDMAMSEDAATTTTTPPKRPRRE